MCNRFGVFMFLLRVRSWSNGHVYNSLHQNQKISEVCFAQNSSGCCKADRAYPASEPAHTTRRPFQIAQRRRSEAELVTEALAPRTRRSDFFLCSWKVDGPTLRPCGSVTIKPMGFFKMPVFT